MRLFICLLALRATPCNIQGFLQAVYSGITPGRAQGTLWDPRGNWEGIKPRLVTCMANAVPTVNLSDLGFHY